MADADQSMDDNDNTTAFGEGVSDTVETALWMRNGVEFHAFSSIDDITDAHNEIQNRMVTLRKRAFDALKNPKRSRENTIVALIAMGQYLHFEQDFFSHRHLTKTALDDKLWEPYGPVKGHIFDGETPDYVGARPRLAALMIRDSYKNIRDFVRLGYGKDQAKEISGAALDTIILEMTKTYFVKDGQPTRDITSFFDQNYVKVDCVPTQKMTVYALFGATLSMDKELEDKGIDGFALNVPIDPEDSQKLHFDRLPYDAPGISLDEITPRVEVDLFKDRWH